MNRKTRARNQSGFTLLELLVYCGLLGAIIAGCMGVFLQANRMFALAALAQDRLVVLRETRQDFVALVHSATGVRDGFGDYAAAPDTLILSLPEEAGQTRTVVCTTRNDEKRLSVFEFTGNEMTDIRWFAKDLGDVAFETMREPGSDAPVVNLRLRIMPEDGERTGAPVIHNFAAAPRGRGK